MNPKTDLYFESHVTIEPVFGDRLNEFKLLAALYRFRVADLIMKKNDGGPELPNKQDSFATSRSKIWNVIRMRTIGKDC